MCQDCKTEWATSNTPFMYVDDTTEILMGLWDRVYSTQGGGCGGQLHIVLDDNNINAESLDFCGKYLVERLDPGGSVDPCTLACAAAIAAMQVTPLEVWVTAFAIWKGWADPQGFVLDESGCRLHLHPHIKAVASQNVVAMRGFCF